MASLKAVTIEKASPRLTAPEERAARKIVAEHRARLDWLLHVPEWEDLLVEGMDELKLPGRRQGVTLAAAVGALPLENKHQLLRGVIPRLSRHLPRATGQRMCFVIGLEPFNDLDLDEVLTARQWQDLARRAIFRLAQEHRRYKQAQQILFLGFRHLVDQVVGQIVFARTHEADCRQEGCLGLLQAIDRVDPSTPGFGGFAVCWIRRSVRNFLMRQRLPVYAPVNMISKASQWQGPDAGPCGGGGSREGRLEAMLLECLLRPALSLEETVPGGAGTVADSVFDRDAESPADLAARTDLCSFVGRLLERLTDKQRDVLIRRFGFNGAAARSLSEVSCAVGISRQQVSMREKRALERLEIALVPLARELHGSF